MGDKCTSQSVCDENAILRLSKSSAAGSWRREVCDRRRDHHLIRSSRHRPAPPPPLPWPPMAANLHTPRALGLLHFLRNGAGRRLVRREEIRHHIRVYRGGASGGGGGGGGQPLSSLEPHPWRRRGCSRRTTRDVENLFLHPAGEPSAACCVCSFFGFEFVGSLK